MYSDTLVLAAFDLSGSVQSSVQFCLVLVVQKSKCKVQSTSEKMFQQNDFQEDMNLAFRELRNDWDFGDMTLACKDGR